MAGRSLRKEIDSHKIITGVLDLANFKYIEEFVKDPNTLAESIYIYLFDSNNNQIKFGSYPSITISSTGTIKLRDDKGLGEKLNKILHFYEKGSSEWKEETYCCAFYGDADDIILGLASLLLASTFAKN